MKTGLIVEFKSGCQMGALPMSAAGFGTWLLITQALK